MNNANKIIYLIGDPIAFVGIDINTNIPRILLFYTIVPTLKFFIKNYPIRKINRCKKYGTTGLQSLERP